MTAENIVSILMCYSQVTTTGSVTTAFLRFTDISAAEAGLYTCLIYFPDSTRSNSISVTVDEGNN